MRVLLMLSSIAMGGGERNIVSLLPHLKAQGLEIDLCTLNTRRDSPLTRPFLETAIQRHDLGAQRMFDRDAWRRFVHLVERERYDLVHAQDQDTIIYAALAGRHHHIPSVMTRHVMDEPAGTIKTAVRARLVLWAARFGIHRIIAVSNAVKHHFAQLAKVPLSKIETIYNGIETDKFDLAVDQASLRKELGWGIDERVITLVAVLRPGKGHEVLFEALPHIQDAVPNARVKLVGYGELHDQFRAQAAQFGDTVEFLGERMDIPEILRASNLVTLPSWSEALPTVLIEAGAAGIPVVATNVGGTCEIVLDEQTGFVVEPGNSQALAEKIIRLLQDSYRAEEMGRAAKERVTELFSLERQAASTIAVYQRLVEA